MANRVDVCIVVEGSYPYVTGGVSSWLQWLIRNLPEYTFGVTALISEPKTPEERQYTFPENLVEYQEFVLSDYKEIQHTSRARISPRKWRRLYRQLYQLMGDWRKGVFTEESVKLLKELIHRKQFKIFHNFFEDEMAFALLTEIYEEPINLRITEESLKKLSNAHLADNLHIPLRMLKNQTYALKTDFIAALEKALGTQRATQYQEVILRYAEKEEKRGDKGFLKYFYNFRNIHLGMFRILTIVSKLPEAKLYHAPGTGYAGLISCLRALVYGGATMITEHGLYLEEREIDLRKVKWLDEPYLRDMWIEYFYSITRWQYSYCKRLITLSDGNKNLMINYGAREEKIQVIPNGISLERFAPARQKRCTKNPRIIGFVGRVDSIKDIKTFIQAVALVKKYYDQIQALVIGPTDERPKYYEECVNLVTMLELQETITFTGRVNVLEYYQKMDVLLLTSIKEGMPLVIIEAMASGIPIVATDVGACKELLYGRANDTLGKAGIVANIMDPKDIALGTLRILRDEKLANRFAQTGIERIEQYYSEELVINQYREIYQKDVGHDRK